MPQPIEMPNIGMPNMSVSIWYVETGDPIFEGDRLVEILAGPATYDIVANCNGRIVQRLSLIDDPVTPGQILGYFEPETA